MVNNVMSGAKTGFNRLVVDADVLTDDETDWRDALEIVGIVPLGKGIAKIAKLGANMLGIGKTAEKAVLSQFEIRRP